MSSEQHTGRLRDWTECGGCGAKWPAAGLVEMLAQRTTRDSDADLLVGLAPFDDAAIYRLTPDLSLVSTIDFFPPLVDDAADFGAIAAANACSDVFAMGGRVILALNVAAFPEAFPLEQVAAIFDAADEVVTAAGGSTAGGHTIRNPEPLFGLAVQGLVPTNRHFAKGGARPNDKILLSKPLGTGLVMSGSGLSTAEAIAGMRRLNKDAAEALVAYFDSVHAVTDVTGFGLLGHAMEMAERSEVLIDIDAARLPLYRSALDAARAGVRTGGDARNREYTAGFVDLADDDERAAIGFDPQTSGGLLAAVDPAAADELVALGFVEIGEVLPLSGEHLVRMR